MAVKVVWTRRAARGLAQIIEYLEYHFTEREVDSFQLELRQFVQQLKHRPTLWPITSIRSNSYKGVMNRYTVIIYRYDPKSEIITLLRIRSTRQRPIL